MKAIYVATLLLLSSISFTSCMENVVEGHGATSSETRSINKTFNSVEIHAPVDAAITVQQGSAASFSLSGYSNLLKHIKTEVKDSTLHIFVSDITELHTEQNLKADIVMPTIAGISISGSSDVIVNGTVVVPQFFVDVSGAGDVTLQSLEADQLSVDMSGAGKFEAQGGRVNTATYDLSGATKLKTYGLESKRVKIDMSGAGKAEVFATEKLLVDASGAASVRYKGDPQLRTDVSGIGSVQRADGRANATDTTAHKDNTGDDDSTDGDW